ncbi:hypothetical protein [Limobrevibacterium gyesilva]|uniref:DUF5666 domain-containing protein n=1 Tax=Limobrevibacterium gyesilva TaxID=2991712 RepID=A0AA42CDR1_9PROT|nr:hypothetical protein [Limobrevibacterium gyesilva]MCW3474244.1 hypothetical protein [Limobrevibacterium gyesilva]
MSMHRRPLLAMSAACLFGAVLPAQAQSPPSTRIRGTIVSLDGPLLTIATREGPHVMVALDDNLRVSALKNVELSEIAPGTFIGTAAIPGPDGGLQAQEVLLFPEAARGSGEGHYAWDLAPGGTMTNATVASQVQGKSGRDLTLTYKGGSVVVTVPPGVPIVTPIPAERTDLKPGAAVFLSATKMPDGTYTTAGVTVGKNGVNPPM